MIQLDEATDRVCKLCRSFGPAIASSLSRGRLIEELPDGEISEHPVSQDMELQACASLLTELFLKAFAHPDSYVYLMTVQAITKLSFFQTVSEPLIAAFMDVYVDRTLSHGSKLRTKYLIGEAMMSLMKHRGPALYHYRSVIINGFLLVASTCPNAFLLASALSNIGEFLYLSPQTLKSVYHELYQLLEMIFVFGERLSCDTQVQTSMEDPVLIKRSAGFVLLKCLAGIKRLQEASEAGSASLLSSEHQVLVQPFEIRLPFAETMSRPFAIEFSKEVGGLVALAEKCLNYRVHHEGDEMLLQYLEQTTVVGASIMLSLVPTSGLEPVATRKPVRAEK